MTSQAKTIEINGWKVEAVTDHESEEKVINGEIPFHPVAEIFPLMTGQAFEDLKVDIQEHGLREPIWIHAGQIIDGRNRYLACREMGVPIRARELPGGDDLVSFVVSLNLHRRHLNESQRGMVGAKVAKMKRGNPTGANQYQKGNGRILPVPKVSNRQAAEMLNISQDPVKKGKVVLKQGVPELVQAVESGEVSVSAAAEVARLPVEKQQAAVAGGKKGIKEAAKRAREQKKQNKKEVEPEAAEAKPGVDGNVIQFPPTRTLSEYEKQLQVKMKIVSKEFKKALKGLKAVIKKEKEEGWVNTSREGALTHLEKLVSWAATK